jgi:hypothetical protein
MKLNLLVGGLLLVCIPFISSAQGKAKTVQKGNKTKTKVSPSWAASHHYNNDHDVYFPDYHTFYDPERGYIYYNKGTWVNSTSVPSYMSTVDMNKARVEIINEDVQMHPETKYTYYRQTYPAQKVEVTVPVPDIR